MVEAHLSDVLATIDDVCSLLKRDRNVAFFVGAAISESSSLPISKKFKKLVLTSLANDMDIEMKKKTGKAIEHIEKNKIPQEQVLQWIHDVAKGATFECLNIYKRGTPNNNHFVLAALAKRGMVDTIITTNFDILLETAFDEVLGKDGYYVCAKDEEFERKEGVGIFKIHGTIKDSQSLGAILKQVNKGMSRRKREVLSGILEENDVIFMGYGAGDFDVREVILSARCRGIFWLLHRPKSETPNITEILDKHEGKRLYGEIDDIFSKINNSVKLGVRAQKVKPLRSDLIENLLNQWVQKLGSWGSAYIWGDIFYHTRRFSDALDSYNMCLSELAKMKNPPRFTKVPGNYDWRWILKAFTLERFGNIHFDNRKMDSAKEHFEEFISLYNEMGQGRSGLNWVLSKVYNRLGEIERERGELQNAISLQRRGIDVAQTINEEERNSLLIMHYTSLALCYRNGNSLDEAMQYLDKAQTIAERIGDLLGKACILDDRGTVLMRRNDKALYDIIIECYDEALKIIKQFPDLRRKGMVYMHRGEIFEAKGDLEGAKRDSETALLVFEKQDVDCTEDIKRVQDTLKRIARKMS
jgi:tetratricopeptide (TPR) repeat protein/NAD-dependent SIR2 family protein deacetylase